MQDTQICAQCGAANPPNNKFCGECGARLQSQTQPPVPPIEDDLPAWLRGETPAQTPAAVEPPITADSRGTRAAEQDAIDAELPDWLSEPAAEMPPLADHVAAPEPAALPNWLAAASDTPGGERVSDTDLPEWLRDASSPSAPNPEAGTPELPAWLGEIGVRDDEAARSTPAPDLPAWLVEEPGTNQAAASPPPSPDVPLWLEAQPDAAGHPASSPAVPEFPAWLADQRSEVAPPQFPTEPELPSWLHDLGSEPATSAASTPAASSEPSLPSWLFADAGAGNAPATAAQQTAPSDSGSAAPPETSSLPAWLRDDTPPTVDAATDLLPSWLQSAAADQNSGEPFTAPDLHAQGHAGTASVGDQDLPPWLVVPAGEATLPAPTEPTPSSAANMAASSEAPFDTSPFGDMPDWLRDDAQTTSTAYSQGEAPSPGSPAAEDEPELPDWLRPAADEQAPARPSPTGELPSWLTTSEPSPTLDAPQAEAGARDAELPAWLREPASAGGDTSMDWLGTPPAAARTSEDDLPPWLQQIDAERGTIEPAADAARLETLDDAKPVARTYETNSETHAARIYSSPDTPSVAEARLETSSIDLPPWLAGLEPPASSPPPPPGALPSWLADADDAPAAPAVQDATAAQEPAPANEFLGSLDLPQWLRDSEPRQAPAPPPEPPAPWLQGLEQEVVVAPAPPVEAPAPNVPEIERTPERRAAMDLLQRVVAEPAPEPIPAPVAPRRSLAITAIQIIAFLLLIAGILAVLLGPRLGFGRISGPELASAGAVISDVAALEPGAPVLLAYEWDARRSAELDPLEDAIVQRLAAQRAPLILLTTEPQGALLTRRRALLLRGRNDNFYNQAGLGFVDLGYKSGNEAALARMVGSFGAIFEQDWAGRNLQREQSVIQSMCQTASGRVEECSIDRVGMIVVLADSAGDIRAWVEQVASRRPEIPIVFVTPAEIGPLAQPYLTRANMALITGLRDALALQALGGTVDEALARRTEATEAGGALFGLLLLGGMLPAIWTGRQARRRAKATIWDR